MILTRMANVILPTTLRALHRFLHNHTTPVKYCHLHLSCTIRYRKLLRRIRPCIRLNLRMTSVVLLSSQHLFYR